MEERYEKEIIAFGKRLREIRLQKGLSQLDIEVATNIAQTEISRIENGLKNIEFFTIVKLANALEIEIGYLFTKELQNKKD